MYSCCAQVINRSVRYKNRYVHRRDSLSLANITLDEKEKLAKIGKKRLGSTLCLSNRRCRLRTDNVFPSGKMGGSNVYVAVGLRTSKSPWCILFSPNGSRCAQREVVHGSCTRLLGMGVNDVATKEVW